MGSGKSNLYEGTVGSKPRLFLPNNNDSLSNNLSTSSEHSIGRGSGTGGSYAAGNASTGFMPGDIVILIREFQHMPIGTIGKILSHEDKTRYVIEFYERSGATIGTFVTPKRYFRLLTS